MTKAITDRPLRVLSISLGRRGGFPIYGFEMTRALSEFCDVSAVVASGSENIDNWRSLSCPTLEVKTYKDRLSAAASFFNLPKFMALKKFILSRDPDIIYYPGSHTWKPILDRIIPKRIPIAMTVHDPVRHPGERYSLTARVLSLVDSRKPDCFILLNESQRDDFIKVNGISEDRVAVIPHGIFSSYRESLSDLRSFPEFNLLSGFYREYFLFIGRIVKYKGIESLLNAFAAALDKTDKLLVIAGNGKFSKEELLALKKLPKDRVMVFNHWLSDAEIATLTSSAFMTILPYEGATQSGIIPVSSALGTPSIASDSGGLKEQIVDGETGFIFSAGSVSELENAISRSSMMSGEEYRKMRENSSKYAYENWDWAVLAKKLAEFLRHCLTCL